MPRTRAALVGIATILLSLAGLYRLASAQAGGLRTDGRQQNRNAPPSACTAVISDTLSPLPLPICREGTMTVTAAISCPTSLPLHVVFVIGRHLGMEGNLDDAKSMARQNVFDLDFTPGTLAGVVSLSVQGRSEVDMTDNKSSVLAAINRLQLDAIAIYANYYDWLGEAQSMLDKARDPNVPALEAIVVYTTGCPTGYEQYCTRQVASARKAKGAGTIILGACPPRASPFGLPVFPGNHCRAIQDMVSRPSYYRDLGQATAIGAELNEILADTAKVKVEKLTLTEILGANFALMPGSPNPVPRLGAGQMAFTWDEALPGTVLTATYRVRALSPGVHAFRDARSQLTFNDSLDRIGGPVALPTRVVTATDCVAATPTPAPSATATLPPPTLAAPTSTGTPVPTDLPTDLPTATKEPTPMPTATPTRSFVYLPFIMRRACRPSKAPSDIVLAIDVSSSMLGDLGGIPKIDAARGAARQFIQLVDLERDQVGLVTYDHEARVAVRLTHARAALEAGLEGVRTGLGTRIDLALSTGAFELLGARAQVDATRVLILLTDGEPEPGTQAEVLATARVLHQAGIQVYAIGFGVADDLDRALLRGIVSHPDAYLEAPDAAALNEAYRQIVRQLPCPGGVLFEPAFPGP